MKSKIISTLAVLSIAVGGSIAVAPVASASTQTVSVAGIANDRLFVKIISSEEPIFKGIPRKTMVKTAKTTCKFLRSGFTIVESVELMASSGFTEDQAMTFVAGAIVFYCPEQEYNY